jgi:hypothetical protein
MRRFLPVVLLTLLCGSAAQSQTSQISPEGLTMLEEYEDSLGYFGFLVINDSASENRFASCKLLIKTLVKALQVENSFHYPFEQLQTVSILYPPDSTFRIFTWQLYVDENDYRYYGAIQMNSPSLKLFPLIDRSFEVVDEEQAQLGPEKWYGALYYNLRQFDQPDGRKYLLFGFDGYSFFNKRKLIDVLGFEDEKPLFGHPVFLEKSEESGTEIVRNRIVKEYSAEASFKMNYEESLEMIIFDHLTSMGGSYNQGDAMVPDGTYEGFQLRDGTWQHVNTIWNEVMEEAPRPEPVFQEGQSRDLFGKTPVKKGNDQP